MANGETSSRGTCMGAVHVPMLCTCAHTARTFLPLPAAAAPSGTFSLGLLLPLVPQLQLLLFFSPFFFCFGLPHAG